MNEVAFTELKKSRYEADAIIDIFFENGISIIELITNNSTNIIEYSF